MKIHGFEESHFTQLTSKKQKLYKKFNAYLEIFQKKKQGKNGVNWTCSFLLLNSFFFFFWGKIIIWGLRLCLIKDRQFWKQNIKTLFISNFSFTFWEKLFMFYFIFIEKEKLPYHTLQSTISYASLSLSYIYMMALDASFLGLSKIVFLKTN